MAVLGHFLGMAVEHGRVAVDAGGFFHIRRCFLL
jgi:hypothetical protein